MKQWQNMTESEIREIKQKKCRFCIYSRNFCTGRESHFSYMYCDYIGVTGKMRGCTPNKCDKFVRTKRGQRKRPINNDGF